MHSNDHITPHMAFYTGPLQALQCRALVPGPKSRFVEVTSLGKKWSLMAKK
jgi:hypothetical protein